MTKDKYLYLALICKFSKGIGNIKGKDILLDPIKRNDLLKSSHLIKSEVEKELNNIKKYSIQTTTILDDDYPSCLLNIYNAPILIYYYGILPKGFAISVVGTRKPSKYGITTTRMIVSQLCEYNIPIISGFAYGVDTVAHQTTLDHKGTTIAVLGTGIDVMYPSANIWMRKKIIDSGGCILTEFPCHTTARPSNFPTRNRIISGLSDGILIVEAGMGSGSLITAELGLEQGKSIFTIPGTIFGDSFKGNHNLVRMGAVLVSNANQILEEFSTIEGFIKKPTTDIEQKKPKKSHQNSNKNTIFNSITSDKENITHIDDMLSSLGSQVLDDIQKDKQLKDLNQDEILVYQIIKEPTVLETIMFHTQFAAPRVLSILTKLILKGLIIEKGGYYYKD